MEEFFILQIRVLRFGLVIRGMEDMKKIQNFSSISPKLCLLGKKNTGTLVVNTTIDLMFNDVK